MTDLGDMLNLLSPKAKDRLIREILETSPFYREVSRIINCRCDNLPERYEDVPVGIDMEDGESFLTMMTIVPCETMPDDAIAIANSQGECLGVITDIGKEDK